MTSHVTPSASSTNLSRFGFELPPHAIYTDSESRIMRSFSTVRTSLVSYMAYTSCFRLLPLLLPVLSVMEWDLAQFAGKSSCFVKDALNPWSVLS
jgi:hypothetical protein